MTLPPPTRASPAAANPCAEGRARQSGPCATLGVPARLSYALTERAAPEVADVGARHRAARVVVGRARSVGTYAARPASGVRRACSCAGSASACAACIGGTRLFGHPQPGRLDLSTLVSRPPCLTPCVRPHTAHAREPVAPGGPSPAAPTLKAIRSGGPFLPGTTRGEPDQNASHTWDATSACMRVHSQA